jgi:hypothetical protein
LGYAVPYSKKETKEEKGKGKEKKKRKYMRCHQSKSDEPHPGLREAELFLPYPFN